VSGGQKPSDSLFPRERIGLSQATGFYLSRVDISYRINGQPVHGAAGAEVESAVERLVDEA
jgi:hypothetical protein